MQHLVGVLTVNINCAIHLAVSDALYRKQTFHETDVTERESSAKTDAEELEEDDCQETEDLRSVINIEHGQNVLNIGVVA